MKTHCPHCGGNNIEDRYEEFRASNQTTHNVVDPIFWCHDCKRELNLKDVEASPLQEIFPSLTAEEVKKLTAKYLAQ